MLKGLYEGNYRMSDAFFPKKRLSEPPILAITNLNKPIIMEAYVWNFTDEAISSQKMVKDKCTQGPAHLGQYASRTTSNSKSN